jgi:hypothetical protein
LIYGAASQLLLISELLPVARALRAKPPANTFFPLPGTSYRVTTRTWQRLYMFLAGHACSCCGCGVQNSLIKSFFFLKNYTFALLLVKSSITPFIINFVKL